LNIKKVNGVVFDLGLSSDHFENSGRGFSFKKDEPLLMTFEKDLTKARFTARDIVNDWDEENIADILYGYGEEKFSRRIAKNIVEARKEKAINTTTDLVEIIEKSVPVWYKKGRKTHFATKTFQALRITVNDELETLKDGLKKGFDALEKQGRLVVVSFHSLEDRIIKNFMRDKKNEREGILITKKPIVPSREEIKENPRSRSAKLRIIEKI
jgi:16S rRNA (cytosine1402-N4)-methyltransferase